MIDLTNNADWSASLLRWYRNHQRDLPWRHTKNPYHIWVSEIMLQQTRVETVKDYYHRFLMRFPDIEALAAAPESDVLKLWEGLGYYSRARNLQRAAQTVVQTLGGKVPDSYADWLRLPGVGAYTGAAIASIAFGEAVPAVDGNVKRVAARLYGIRDPMENLSVLKRMNALLAEAIPVNEAGNFNQAMMELGATVCLPRAPRCDQCPLRLSCDALAEGDAESLPVHEKKQPAKQLEIGVCILTFEGKVLVFRRTERLLHGLYVMLLLEGETDPERAGDILAEDGLSAQLIQCLGKATHVFTHRIWHMTLLHFTLKNRPTDTWLTAHGAQLADTAQLSALPIPTAMNAAKAAALKILAKA